MVDKDDGVAYTKYIRNLRSTENLLRQFLKLETGVGNISAYRRGHVFNFEWTQEQRDIVNKLMESEGLSFEEAFDKVYQQPRGNHEHDDRAGSEEASSSQGQSTPDAD